MNLILGRRVLANGLILATTIITCSSLQADEQETKQLPASATAQSGERANGGANRDVTAASQPMFIQKALMDGQMEVRAGELAQRKGQSQDVRNLGQALVRDHTEANQKLQQIAQSLNIPASPGIANLANKDAAPDRVHDSGKHQAHDHAIAKLESQSGADFDKEFVRMAIKHHKKDIAQFEQAQREVSDPQLKSFIDGTLPKLRQHLQMAQTAARNVGVDPSTIINDDWDRAPGTGAPAAGQIGTEPSNSNPGLTTGSSAQNGGAVSTEVKVGDHSVTTDVDVKTDADANGKVFQKDDGKILGLPTSKTDGKYLGIPVPDGKKDSADANVDVEVNKK